MPVTPVPALKDNYVWMFPTGPDRQAAVDPGAAAPVLRVLERTGAGLSHILITHHHHDHIGGVAELVRRTGARVVGAAADSDRLPPLASAVADGQILTLGTVTGRVLTVPGHTMGHVAYLVGDALFCGDTLFSAGCGRLFEGSPEQMWTSLTRLRALPDATRVCCAHEYTLTNLEFVGTLWPDDPDLQALFAAAAARADRDVPTLPTLLGQEKRHNPFLRCDDPALAKRLGQAGQSPTMVFAHLRELRNRH
ncbi:MAG: hydroxyacylglutathione hydrolase [Magnetococcales bacterium]|nr:hydroxyacylglutathione hydrolase [Magnetococcales bacterium]